ncbi:MAG: cryptochrome/photolyase family protein [Mycobacterium sp.]|jgi:deoxyribodipyrimidine photo-lyase
MPAVLWFRRDLRLTDLPALLAAADVDGDVLGCFVLDPRLEASSGSRRLQFLGDSLRHLYDDLNGRLLVVRGSAEKRIPLIARDIGADSVHISEDFTPFGRRRDEQVRKALADVPLVATGSPYLVSPGRVVKDDGSPYKVFTPYFRRWREHGWRGPAKSTARSARWIDPADLTHKSLRPVEIPDSGVEMDVAAGEAAAAAQWKNFVADNLEHYHHERDRPDLARTSRMSGPLKFGTIHPRTMAADLNTRREGDAAYLRELAFRDFYADVLNHWPRSAWWNWNTDFDAIETDSGADAETLFQAWKSGRTGFPIVDAGMRQLSETGFMHNRVRMIVASFLVKDLHLPWQWGARWFLEQLVDGDMASNQHGWQWCAGSGTDAAPYFRVFNPSTQGQKFDPAGDYIRRWIPELVDADDPHLKNGQGHPGYPERVVDHGRERTEALRRYSELTRK